MKNPAQHLILSDRFTHAVDYARSLHTETRKGTQIPFMAHLLGVAALVMGEAGGPIPVTEDMVIGAILHDDSRGPWRQAAPRRRQKEFGENVARMVEGRSNIFGRRSRHEGRLGGKQGRLLGARLRRYRALKTFLSTAADKLYNAKAVLDDLKEIGPAVWKRFKRGPKEQLWYFHSLIAIFRLRLPGRITAELEWVVSEIAHLVNNGWPGTNVMRGLTNSEPTAASGEPTPGRRKH